LLIKIVEEKVIKRETEILADKMKHLTVQVEKSKATPTKSTTPATPQPKSTPSKGTPTYSLPTHTIAASDDELQPSGKVVHIVESKQSKHLVGYIKPVNESGVKPEDRFACFYPIDIKLPRMLLPIGQVPDFYKDPESYNTKLVIAELVNWRPDSYFPLGKYQAVLGESGDIVPETEAIMVQYGVDGSDFPAEVLDSIPKESYKISEEEIRNRRDLRNYRIFTVDPATAKDLDDALHITALSDGNHRVSSVL
jgi:exoribonuclease R